MTIKEQLEYIVNKFKAELQEGWKVEITSYCSAYDKNGYEIKRFSYGDLYLHITNGQYHYQYDLYGIIHDLSASFATVSNAYNVIKSELKYSYLKMLFKEI